MGINWKTYLGVAETPFIGVCVSLIVHVTRFGTDAVKGLPSYNCSVTFISSVMNETTFSEANTSSILKSTTMLKGKKQRKI